MNFERKNKDPYEILRIGERANAPEFKTIHIIVIHTHMEKKFDVNAKIESQSVILLQKRQIDHLMSKLQEGILSKELILGVLARGSAPGNPIFVSPPIFYINKEVKWPSSIPDYTDRSHYIEDIVEKWIIVNGKFWKLPKILADIYPKSTRGYGWAI